METSTLKHQQQQVPHGDKPTALFDKEDMRWVAEEEKQLQHQRALLWKTLHEQQEMRKQLEHVLLTRESVLQQVNQRTQVFDLLPALKAKFATKKKALERLLANVTKSM